jgi:hypothetical protein
MYSSQAKERFKNLVSTATIKSGVVVGRGLLLLWWIMFPDVATHYSTAQTNVEMTSLCEKIYQDT